MEHAESGSAVFVTTTAPSLATLVSGGDASNSVAMELAADSSAMHTSRYKLHSVTLKFNFLFLSSELLLCCNMS